MRYRPNGYCYELEKKILMQKQALLLLFCLLNICVMNGSRAFAQQVKGGIGLMNSEPAANAATSGTAADKPHVLIEKRGGLTYVVGSVLINAPREKVWETLVDYDKSPEIFTNLSLCRVIGTEGGVKLVRQLVKPGGPIKFDYVVNLTETRPSLIKWKRRSGSFREVMGTWELEPVAKTSSTSVVYSIHLDGGLVLPPWLLASQVKGYLPTVLNALKSRVESSQQGRKS